MRTLHPVQLTNGAVTQSRSSLTSISHGACLVEGDLQTLLWQVMLVIDLSADPTVGDALGALSRALKHARVQARSLDERDPGRTVRDILAELPDQSSATLLVLGDPTPEAMSQAESILAALDASHEARPVVVSENPDAWSRLSSVRGYLRGAHGRLGIDAAKLALHLAALHAPDLFIGIDVEDWCHAIGSAAAPSTLAHAYWQFDGDRRSLIFLSREEQTAVATASSVAVLPLYDCTSVRETRCVVEELAKVIAPHCILVANAPGRCIRWGAMLGGTPGSLSLVCR